MSKISQYPPASTLDGTELVPVVQDGVTVQTTVADIVAAGVPGDPVTSVNGQTGTVLLDAADVGADASGTAAALVIAHNAAPAAHGGVQAAFAAHTGAGGTTHPLATALARGFMPALSGLSNQFLAGDGTWSGIAGAGDILAPLIYPSEPDIDDAITLPDSAMDKFHRIVDNGAFSDYAITLPAAADNAGKLIGFRVAPYALATRQFLITPASGEAIDGRAADAVLALVHTNTLVLLSDGVGWTSIVKKVDTDWVDVAGGLTGSNKISAVTTAPTPGVTTRSKLLWRRVGGSIETSIEFIQASGGSAGSGQYLFPVTAGFTSSSFFSGNITEGACVGSSRSNDGSDTVDGTACLYSATHATVCGESFIGSIFQSMTGTQKYFLRSVTPIANW